MYKPKKDNRVFEVRGEDIGFDGTGNEYVFGYSKMTDYDKDKQEMFADDIGYWVSCENIYKTGLKPSDVKLGGVEVHLTDEQLKKFVDGAEKWQDIDSIKNGMLERLISDRFLFDSMKKYVRMKDNNQKKKVFNNLMPCHLYSLFPKQMLIEIGVSEEDISAIEKHYEEEYTDRILLEKFLYYLQVVQAFRELIMEDKSWKDLMNAEDGKIMKVCFTRLQ